MFWNLNTILLLWRVFLDNTKSFSLEGYDNHVMVNK